MIYFRYDTDSDLYRKRVIETVNISKERVQDPVKSDDPHELRYVVLEKLDCKASVTMNDLAMLIAMVLICYILYTSWQI